MRSIGRWAGGSLRLMAAALFVLATVLILGACAATPEEGGSSAPARRFLSLGTAPPGGAFFVVGGALSEVLNEARAEEGWTVTAEATKGSQENIRRLVTGELDLALSNSAITYFAVRGEGWDEPQGVRTVMTLAPNIAMFITPRGSGVETMQDLAGKRVVVGPAGAGFDFFVRPLVEAHGVGWDDFTRLNNSQQGAVDLLSDGSAAAAFLGGAVPTASITQASSSMDIHFVPFTEEVKASLITDYPFFNPATIPAGTYRGQEEPFEGLNVGSMHLITAAAADEELIYQVTRSIYENRDKVVSRHPAGRAINPDNAARFTGTEFHPGAIRFYQEIGIWPQDAPATESE